MKIDVLTLFPEMFSGFLQESMIAIAQREKKLEVNLINIRDFAFDKHRTADDYPYGGGAGMVMRPEPIHEALKSIKDYENTTLIYFTPSFCQALRDASPVFLRFSGFLYLSI